MYFRSFSLLATFACAGLAVAAPLSTNDFKGPAGNTPTLPNVPSSLVTGACAGEVSQPELLGAVGGIMNGVGTLVAGPRGCSPSRRDETHLSLPEIFKEIVGKVNPVADKLKVAVAVKAEIDAGVVVGLLHEIIDILDWAIIQVQYIVDNPAGFVLSVGDAILSIEAVATIISITLHVIFTVLAIVVATVDGALYDLVLPLVVSIGHQVTQLLALALHLVPGLLTFIVATVGNLLQTLYYLKVADVVAILGFPPLV